MKQFLRKFNEKKGEGIGKAAYDGIVFLLVLLLIICVVVLFNTVRTNFQKTTTSVNNVNTAIMNNAAAGGSEIKFKVDTDGVIVEDVPAGP